MLKGKTVVVGVCGGIAAYKAVEVVSRFSKLNAEVNVIMTAHAVKFISPLTFSSISHKPVITGMFDEPGEWEIKHISLAKKADIIVIAPATANIIGKIANGIADDMLTTTVMASKSPVLFVPAMNYNMYGNPIVKDNIARLNNYGYRLMEPDTGTMAEGTSGKGRLPEPVRIVEEACRILNTKRDMEGLKVLVTAGPTREPIDPVRFISNRSSGKMGYSVAQAAAKRGASVKLISGPVCLARPENVEIENVLTAEDMYRAVMASYEKYDVIVMLAAVADYRCPTVSDRKLKKNDENMVIRLERNTDILTELGRLKGKRLLVGSCAETGDLEQNAGQKLVSKNLDMIIANDVTMEGAGFEVDTNIIKLIKRDGSLRELPLMQKTDAAHLILDEITTMGEFRR